MATIESILKNIGSEPSVNALIEPKEYSIDLEFEYYNSSENKLHGDDIYIVPRADIKEHEAATAYSTEELLEKISNLTEK